jgi:glutathione synthase/RimK-type ligase-like ATP-grasp enzyme
MQRIIIVDNPSDWPLTLPDVRIISARDYLTTETFRKERNIRVYNLCTSYRYQSIGYYVSLLAAARGHKPVPSVATIQDMKSQAIVRLAGEEIDELVQKSLHDIQSDEFVLSMYFGKNVSKKYDRLSAQLYRLFHAPFVRAHFHKERDDDGLRWRLRKIGPISAKDIPKGHHDSVIDFAKEYFEGKRAGIAKRPDVRFSVAILIDKEDPMPPSNEGAIKRFIRAAEKLHMECEIIDRDDYSRIPEFDALFIRETTAVNHHTYRFARRAAAEGLVVIDDPESILKCTNKVFLDELLSKNNIPVPRALVVMRENAHEIETKVGLPCVLKQPDSSFSQGVVKVDDKGSLDKELMRLFEKSDLVIAQEFMPTDFDWRVGILDGKPLYVSKYFMVKKDWKVISKDGSGRTLNGRSESLPVHAAPKKLISLAVKAAELIGDGLYGLDIKQVGERFVVIEINDNPNIDYNYEDLILKDELYERIMEVFLKRITAIKEGRAKA